ncbi:cytochrome bc1 complex cytochrome b subunit [Nocardioides antri]
MTARPDLAGVAQRNRGPAVPSRPSRAGAVASWADDRLGLAKLPRLMSLRKVFPDHWSFMLGEVALWSFVVLLITGVFLTLWFDPSMAEVAYQGSYDPLRGVDMSAAYASTLDISFDVRGGLLMRQMHHWAAHVFIAAMMIHLLRHALTGSFRKPREVNWVIGTMLLLFGTLNGFLGYSLPDDLLSGTGLRAFDGFLKATPVVGTYLSFLVFGGEFPGDQIIPRFYVFHVLLIPGLLLALVALHLILVVYHKHTQWPGPGRTEQNVVGAPFWPVYTAKAGGFFLVVFGLIALMGGLFSINSVWKFGPYDPSKVTAGSQPDWYMGWPDGLLRIIPPLETHAWGVTISWNVVIPILVAPPTLLLVVMLLPFIEARITGDKREHHLLQRPRDVPHRTALMAALVTFYGLAWMAGGNDIIAIKMHLSINQVTYALRVLIFVGPVLAFMITKRWCISLQRHDRDRLLHGRETGVIRRSPDGGYNEKHLPLSPERAYALSVAMRGELGEAQVETRAHADERS